MKSMLVSESGDVVTCRLADTFIARFMGWMGQSPPPDGEGLLIIPCNSIHMFFMKFPIDAVFMDREFRVVRLVRNLAPGRMIGTVPGACQVLEVVAGELPESFREGSRLVHKAV